jgi:hypothetical protein
MYVKRNTEARLFNQCCRKKISITYSECMSVASVIQHAMRMRRTILSSVACLALSFSSTLSHKDTIFGEKNIKPKYVFFSLLGLSDSMQRTRFSCQILMKAEFWTSFQKNTQITNFTKIRPVGFMLFHTDGQTSRS